jgi:hypothetical protein
VLIDCSDVRAQESLKISDIVEGERVDQVRAISACGLTFLHLDFDNRILCSLVILNLSGTHVSFNAFKELRFLSLQFLNVSS